MRCAALSVLVLAALAILPGSAGAASNSCRIHSWPWIPEETLPRHNVQFEINCDANKDDNDRVFAKVHVFGNQSGVTSFGAEDGLRDCTIAPTALDCLTDDVPLAASGYRALGIIEYNAPLGCADEIDPTSISATVTLLNPETGATETIDASGPGPCAGSLSLDGVPKHCVRKPFSVTLGVPDALHSLLAISRGNDPQDDYAYLRILRGGHELKRAEPLPGRLRDGFSFPVPADKLKPGRYELRTLVGAYDPSDYPLASAAFRRC